jgi:hypothetical protein
MNTLRPVDEYYLKLREPVKGCMELLRDFILQLDVQVSEEWKYKMPFYYYKGKMFCYLWMHKKYKQPYLGIVKGQQLHHPLLLKEDRTQISILLFDPMEDIPLDTIGNILKEAMKLYK